MGIIKPLNQELSTDEMEELILELVERDEFSCTGNTCPAHSCGVVILE